MKGRADDGRSTAVQRCSKVTCVSVGELLLKKKRCKGLYQHAELLTLTRGRKCSASCLLLFISLDRPQKKGDSEGDVGGSEVA